MRAVKALVALHLLALLFCSASHSYASGSIVLILDDLGNQRDIGREAIDIPWVSTVAVMPGRPFSQELAEYAHARSKEVIIHAPMSNTTDFPLGALGLDRADGKVQLLANLQKAIQSVPYAVGLSNHMGSRLTQDREAMNWVMKELKQAGFYFFDSRTIATTIAWEAARDAHIPWSIRQIFLDHYQTQEFIAGQWQKAVDRARDGENITVICHPYAETIRFFRELDPAQYELTQTAPLSSVLNYAPVQLPLRNFPEGA
ncbi:divergent polysaccharide deacetylase family protein [Reinekea marinisedimentorum]|uniref:Divergent polysaccharide deacetylase n=1 Tax=Reinekea marinisedimentorum TaxID=230495 RepID=A0A4R3IC98_9GAMM|nr:divergent polysaccharide deacetylase family protein [Reinekea marinisedimentorum]TCS43007.1 hypothetical protein BCF53_10230 [Reinekea marinisedimentorum]